MNERYYFKRGIGAFRFDPKTHQLWRLSIGAPEQIRAKVAIRHYLKTCDEVPERVARVHAESETKRKVM